MCQRLWIVAASVLITCTESDRPAILYVTGDETLAQEIVLDYAFAGYLGDAIAIQSGQHRLEIKDEFGAALRFDLESDSGSIAIDRKRIIRYCNPRVVVYEGWHADFTPEKGQNRLHVHPPDRLESDYRKLCERHGRPGSAPISRIKLLSSPPGASVYQNGEMIGKANGLDDLPLRFGAEGARLVFRMRGYANCLEHLESAVPDGTLACSLVVLE